MMYIMVKITFNIDHIIHFYILTFNDKGDIMYLLGKLIVFITI